MSSQEVMHVAIGVHLRLAAGLVLLEGHNEDLD
jgi:hypothetical protein